MLNSTKLSLVRILVVAVVYAAIPYASEAVNHILLNETISRTLVLCTAAVVLIIMNFDILDLHAKRLKGKLGDFVLFAVVSSFLVAFAFFINEQWLHTEVWTPEIEILRKYAFFIPTILLSYSYGYSFIFMITFKAVTDRFKVTIGEKVIIFFSGLLFGMLTALSVCMSTDLNVLIPSFIFHMIISMTASYSYNQTHSILPMAVGYGTVLLLSMI